MSDAGPRESLLREVQQQQRLPEAYIHYDDVVPGNKIGRGREGL